MRWLGHALIIAVHLSLVTIVGAQESAHEFVPGTVMRERLAPGVHSAYNNQPGGAITGGRPGSMRPRTPLNTRPHDSAPAPHHLHPIPLPEVVSPSIRIP